MKVGAAAAAWIVTLLPFCSVAQTPATPKPVTGQQVEPAIMEYYPIAARAAGVAGTAALDCLETEHARLTDCTLVSESPTGFGFGEAALKLAMLSKDNPRVSDPSLRKRRPLAFTFSLEPPSIQPDMLKWMGVMSVIKNPDYARKPDPALMKWPLAALLKRVSGRVVVDCVVTKEAKLDPCVVLEEQPAGWGFGQAALNFVATFRMTPMTRDGEPVGGAHLRVPVDFLLPK